MCCVLPCVSGFGSTTRARRLLHVRARAVETSALLVLKNGDASLATTQPFLT